MFYSSPFFYWDASSVRNEVVLISKDKKHFFSLNEVASFLWPFLKKGISLEAMTNKACKQFEVSQEIAEKDINTWLKQGLKEGYILRERDSVKKTNVSTKFFNFVSKLFTK